MSAPAAVLSAAELDRLWGSDEPDLELDQDGRIRPIAVPRPDVPRGSAIGSAAPVALGAIVSSVSRWD